MKGGGGEAKIEANANSNIEAKNAMDELTTMVLRLSPHLFLRLRLLCPSANIRPEIRKVAERRLGLKPTHTEEQWPTRRPMTKLQQSLMKRQRETRKKEPKINLDERQCG